MSGWVTFLLVVIGMFGQPLSRASRVAHVAWTLVVLGLLAALLIDAKGWPT